MPNPNNVSTLGISHCGPKPANRMDIIYGQKIHATHEEKKILVVVALIAPCCIYLILKRWTHLSGSSSLVVCLPWTIKRDAHALLGDRLT